MQRIGILSKTSRSGKGQSLVFADPENPKTEAYRTMPFSKALIAQFIKMSEMQQCLLATPAPKTIDEWNGGLAQFKKVAATSKTDSYSVLWTYRSAMVAEMAVANIKNLRFKSSNTVRDITTGFPDQSTWVRKLTWDGKNVQLGMSITKLLRNIKYTDSLQYLTMDLCILMTAARGMSPQDVKALEPEIKKVRKAMDKIDRPAHPAIVVDMARKQSQ